MARAAHLIPIYTSRGEPAAFLAYPYLYNSDGAWIGWVTSDRQVYSVQGQHVGYLSDGPRILSKASNTPVRPRRIPPTPPARIQIPAHIPLAPLMSELMSGTVDVLEERIDLLPPVDFGDLRQDMD